MINVITLAAKGFISGFTLAAPGEAISFLDVKETESGISQGIITGFAAASADLVYGILAVIIFQTSRIFLTGNERWLILLGGIFLCFFGTKRFLDTPMLNKVRRIDGNKRKIFIAAFLFTLTNASTILEFLSLFIGFDIEFSKHHELLFFVAGVFFGSLFWWFCVSIADELLKKKISLKILRSLNYISGFTIFCFGIYTLSQLLIH
jgi:threonine/homoserine/homoserine lactone efflux protein